MTITQDQYKGCLLGLALGDALGAPYEGGPLERLLWWAIGRTKDKLPRWTDDTQMTLDLAESLLQCNVLDQDDLAKRFARSYAWRRGYGPSTARVLRRIRGGEHWATASKKEHQSGSFGNGAAMRASVLALFFTDNRAALLQAARSSAEVTHAHPLGIEGAILIALATDNLLRRGTIAQTIKDALANCNAPQFGKRLNILSNWIDTQSSPSPKEVAKTLGNGMTAETSAVTALYIALRHLHAEFQQMMRFIIDCGGDVDTIAAMAGTLWGAYHGATALPDIQIERRAEIEQTAIRLHQRVNNPGPP